MPVSAARSDMLRGEVRALALALQFLTRLPVPAPYCAAAMAAAPRYFALVGAGIGAVSGAVLLVAAPLLGDMPAVLLALTAGIVLTGALHEDGLADTCDGLGGGHTREHALEIMRDSRIGTYGALALMLSLGLRAAALMALGPALGAAALVAGHAASRMSVVLAMTTGVYARAEGAGQAMAGPVSIATPVLAVANGLAAILVLPAAVWPAALAGLALAHAATRLAYGRKLGGYTGDCLGAVQQTGEIGLYLGVLAWL